MPDDSLKTSDKMEPQKQPTTYTPPEDEAALESQSLAAVESESPSDAPLNDDLSVKADAQPAKNDEVVTPHASQIQEKKSKRSKTPYIVAAVVFFILLLGSGSAAAYMWYQNPEKVVLDGIMNAVKSKTFVASGSSYIEFKEGSINIQYDGQTGVDAGAAGSVRVTVATQNFPKIMFSGDAKYVKNGDMYVRANDIQKTYETALDGYINSSTKNLGDEEPISDADKKSLKQEFDQGIKPIITKIDNKWIKVSAKDLKDLNKDAGTEYDCTQKALNKFINDKKASDKIRDLYMKHRMLAIKQTDEANGDNKSYKITVNKDAATAFNKDLKNLPEYSEINKCSKDSSDLLPSSLFGSSSNSSETVVWVNQWSHLITDFRFTGSGAENSITSYRLDGTTSFNKPVTVTPPKDSISIKDLQKEIEKLSPALLGSSAEEESTVI